MAHSLIDGCMHPCQICSVPRSACRGCRLPLAGAKKNSAGNCLWLASAILARAWGGFIQAFVILAIMEVMWRPGPSGSLHRWRLVCSS